MQVQEKAFPERITLELTNECNYRCPMCPSRFGSSEPRGLMPDDLFRRLVDEAAEHRPVALVPFFRGESTIHPSIVPLLVYAKKKGLGPIQLANNGSLMTEDLAQKLLDLGLDFISFSLDTIRPEEYSRIRVGGRLDRVMRNVESFIELRNWGNYSTEVQVSATRTTHNRESIDEFIEYWKDRSDRVRIYYEHSMDGHTGSLVCPEVPGCMDRRPCPKPFNEIVVYYDGQVALCNHDWYRGSALGEVNTGSITRVWTGEAYRRIREQHQNPSTMTDELCLHCDHWKVPYLENNLIGELYTSEGGGVHAG